MNATNTNTNTTTLTPFIGEHVTIVRTANGGTFTFTGVVTSSWTLDEGHGNGGFSSKGIDSIEVTA